jgi:hypothetical protein
MPMSLRPPRAQGPAAPVDGPIDPNWGLTMDGAGLPVGDEAPEAVRCPPRRLTTGQRKSERHAPACHDAA